VCFFGKERPVAESAPVKLDVPFPHERHRNGGNAVRAPKRRRRACWGRMIHGRNVGKDWGGRHQTKLAIQKRSPVDPGKQRRPPGGWGGGLMRPTFFEKKGQAEKVIRLSPGGACLFARICGPQNRDGTSTHFRGKGGK